MNKSSTRHLRSLACLGVVLAAGCSESSVLEIRAHESLEESTGLAGLVLRVEGQEFEAEDFQPDDRGSVPDVSLEVPNSGRLRIEVQLHQDGDVTAEGSVGWALRNEHEWGLDIFRQVEDPTETCFGCEGMERIEITENAQSEPGEALWFAWGGRPKGSDIVY